jgi:hypothetical protein
MVSTDEIGQRAASQFQAFVRRWFMALFSCLFGAFLQSPQWAKIA